MSACCAVCGKEARARCGQCGVEGYCGRAHQVVAWRRHKAECKIEAAVSRALKRLGAEEPKTAGRCWICLDECATLGGCGCRGTSGAVHGACVYESVKSKTVDMIKCRTCSLDYHGTVALEVASRYWRADPRSERAMHVLSYVLVNSGEMEQGFQLRKRLCEISERTLGSEHRNTVVNVIEYARLLLRDGRAADAATLLESRALRLSGGHCTTVTDFQVARLYATALGETNRVAEARDVLEPVLADAVQNLGAEHVVTVELTAHYAVALWYLCHQKRARDMTADVVAISKRVFGPKHAWTLEVLQRLAYMDAHLGASGVSSDALRCP